MESSTPTPATPTPDKLEMSLKLQWQSRAKTQGYNWGSATYRKAEVEFFVGACASLITAGVYPTVPTWMAIPVMVGDCIVPKDYHVQAS